MSADLSPMFVPLFAATCETYTCGADQRDIEFCFQCPDFPCDRLCPASDRADTLPHNLKIFNLCFIKEKGRQLRGER